MIHYIIVPSLYWMVIHSKYWAIMLCLEQDVPVCYHVVRSIW